MRDALVTAVLVTARLLAAHSARRTDGALVYTLDRDVSGRARSASWAGTE